MKRAEEGADNGLFASLADLVYAGAMLKQTPRSGLAFLGSGKESVAEHSFLAAFIGYILARKAQADTGKTVLMCLFHDLHEAATGDFNYVNHRYDQADERQALLDICSGSSLSGQILSFWEEFEAKSTLESRLAHDADQLDLICTLRKEQARGNDFAVEWQKSAVQRICTIWGQRLCKAIMETDPRHWWYDQVDEEWWINRKKNS